MAAILITCPATLAAVHTGQHSMASKFGSEAFHGASFRCSACGAIHAWHKEDAWIAGSAAPQSGQRG
jgi:ribosomal protein L37E